MRKLTLLVVLSVFFQLQVIAPTNATCTSTQLSQIRQLETQLQQRQRTLSRENEFLTKTNIKINDLQQKLNRYLKSKNMSSFVSSTQRQLETALREQGQALRKVSDAQRWVDMAINKLTNAQRRCS